MKNPRLAILIAVFGLTGLLFPAFCPADERTEPIDVIISLDKSLSMVEEVEAVKEYVNGYLIDQLLIPGDFFLVVAFYGKTEVPVSMTIQGPADKDRAKSVISGLLADGHFTDIGNALDELGTQVEKYSRPDRKKFLLLITDGIQEAPPQSRYYSPDGKFNHAFLENTKVIQKKGWKVHILGVGNDPGAAQLAEELAGTYIGISGEPTKDELVDKTREFLAALQVKAGPTLAPVDWRGRSRLALTVESQGYLVTKTVQVREVTLSLPGGRLVNILPEPASLTVPAGQTQEFAAAVRLPSRLPAGDQRGTLSFDFVGQDRFLPVILDVDYHVKTLLENFWLWLLIGAVLLAVLILLLIRLIARMLRPKYRFRLEVHGQKSDRRQDIHVVREGKPQYLDLTQGTLQISRSRGEGSLARLVAVGKGLRLTVLKSEHFPKLREPPLNILDFDFLVRTNIEKRTDTAVRLTRVK